MSLFGTILTKIFHHDGAGATAPTQTAANDTGSAPSTAAPSAGATVPPPPTPASPAPAQPSQDTSAPATASAAPASAPVDVAAVMDGLAAKNSQTLDWKHSIVDMMKLLDMDSSLSARKTLAQELHYTGDTGDSAAMNIWLHKQVMQKLAENGGKVPDDLKG